MAKFKVRIVLNRGRHGAPLAKLGRISEQAEKFLRSLAADCQVDTRPGEWLAVNFGDGSVAYDAEFQGEVNDGHALAFATNLEFLADYDATSAGLNGAVSHNTAFEYAKIGALIDPDEVIGLGIYSGQDGAPKWRNITYGKMASIRREMDTPLPAYGAVQGILHAWFKEAREPSFQLRELSTEAIVKVLYPPALYADIAKAVWERSTMLIISGTISYNQATRAPTEMFADRIEQQRMLSNAEFESFIGSAPDFIANYGDDDLEETA